MEEKEMINLMVEKELTDLCAIKGTKLSDNVLSLILLKMKRSMIILLRKIYNQDYHHHQHHSILIIYLKNKKKSSKCLRHNYNHNQNYNQNYNHHHHYNLYLVVMICLPGILGHFLQFQYRHHQVRNTSQDLSLIKFSFF